MATNPRNRVVFSLPKALIFLLTVASRSSCILAREDNFVNRLFCFTSFALTGFDIVDFDSYPNFFNDETVMELAETGKFIGVQGIEEYVRFGGDASSAYILETIVLDQNPKVKTASDPDTGACVMTVVATLSYRFDDSVVKERVHTVPALLNIFYEPQGIGGLSGIAISRINLYYDGNFLADFFDNLLITDASREFVCETMKVSCPEIWELNGLDTIGECTTKLLNAPNVDGLADVTGDVTGCRVLHAPLASVNPDKHCPHISFVAVPDPDGLTKCQTSEGNNFMDLFDAEDIARFEERVEALGFSAEQPYTFCDCSEESAFWHPFFVGAWKLFYQIPLLPETWLFGDIPMCTLCE